MKPFLSVIVPVYNVKQYLGKCIDSILAQSFKDYELILVDDGSDDQSGKICDEYAQKDNRIIVCHKDNGGLSDARNTGIDLAKGEYLTFIDSDDYVDKNMFEQMSALAKKTDCDMVMTTSYSKFSGDKTVTNNTLKPTGEIKECTPAEALVYIFNVTSRWNVTGNFCKAKLFEGNRFEVGKLYEDINILPELINSCKKVYMYHKSYYYYRVREDSIMGQSMEKISVDLVYAVERNIDFIKGCDYTDEEKKQIVAGMLKEISSWLNHAYNVGTVKLNREYIKCARRLLRKNISFVLSSKKVSFKDKIYLLLNAYNMTSFLKLEATVKNKLKHN